tara:strand:- start:1577 stop:2161 length:585 start_codon:yes stop_codon:yes gene_type:complete
MNTIECRLCRRIETHLRELKIKYPSYHCKPVWGSGNLDSELCIVGLAPGLHGANKTGTPFTADYSGLLMREILDELNISNFFITNVVRCYPKNNLPFSDEKNNCQKHNDDEISKLQNLKVIITLGEVAYRQIIKLYGVSCSNKRFVHGNIIRLNDKVQLISSYHCSKLNINTNRVSKTMLKKIFLKAIMLTSHG